MSAARSVIGGYFGEYLVLCTGVSWIQLLNTDEDIKWSEWKERIRVFYYMCAPFISITKLKDVLCKRLASIAIECLLLATEKVLVVRRCLTCRVWNGSR